MTGWNKIIDVVMGSISDLNNSAKMNNKSAYVNDTKVIIKAIQAIFSVFNLTFFNFKKKKKKKRKEKKRNSR